MTDNATDAASRPVTQVEAESMLATMARMQDGYNQVLHEAWRQQGFEFYRAIWVECAELLDHYGWKWWKHTTPDLDQVKLELVDIWHFGLSDLMQAGADPGSFAPAFLALGMGAPTTPEAFRQSVETFASQTLSSRKFSLSDFLPVLAGLPLPLEELFNLYVGKNVLNGFRQDHGYRTGEYRKLWSGREDNEHLVEAIAALDCSATDMPEQLYAALTIRYTAGQPAGAKS